jgi:hypothetical protein
MALRLLNLLTALSLLMCVAACVLWVRSYWRYDHAEFKAAAAGGAPCFGAAVWSANGRGTCCWSQTPARKDRRRELYAYSRPDVARYDSLQRDYCKPMLQHGRNRIGDIHSFSSIVNVPSLPPSARRGVTCDKGT